MVPKNKKPYVQLDICLKKIVLLTKRLLLFWLMLLILTSCSNEEKKKIIILHEGPYTVKAEYVNDRRNGKTEIFDSSGKLGGIVHYKDDLRSGICIHYFPNGVVSDSVHYECDKAQGYWKHYSQDGSLKHIPYFYFGLQFGPDLWYQQGNVLKSFSFLDFEQHPILESSYNNRGHIISIDNVALPIRLTKKDKNGLPLVEFFAYLPQVPLVEHTYSIGISDMNKNSRKLCNIQGSNFFIDTMLSTPPPGYHFYLKCDLHASEGGIDTTLITEAIEK